MSGTGFTADEKRVAIELELFEALRPWAEEDGIALQFLSATRWLALGLGSATLAACSGHGTRAAAPAMAAPASTTARMAGSSATRCAASVSSAFISVDSALRASGRLSVSVATPSSTCSRRSDMAMDAGCGRVAASVAQPYHAPMSVTQRTLRVAGVDVRIDEPEGARPQDTLVFLHGWPDSADLWDATVAALRFLARVLGRRCGGSTGTNLWGALVLADVEVIGLTRLRSDLEDVYQSIGRDEVN